MIEFQFTLDEYGNPIIKFTHDEKSNELEQMALYRFIQQANISGIRLYNPNGSLSNNQSIENYYISVNRE